MNQIPKSGTFGITTRVAREGRHPQTGKTIKISASNHTKFRAGAVMKEAIS